MAFVVGTRGPDDRDGTEGADTIWLYSGSDTARGLGGDDVIYGSYGSDELYGGDGNDTLEAGHADGKGPDTLYGGSGDDTIDLILIDPGNVVSGGTGNDLLILQNSTLQALPLNFFIEIGQTFNVILNGRAVASVEEVEQFQIETMGGNDTVIGGDNNDTISTGDGYDSVHGGAGDDNLYVGKGGFWVDGGLGSDRVGIDLSDRTENFTITVRKGAFDIAGIGSVRGAESVGIRGGQGDDRITTGNGSDDLDGGLGDDFLSAGNGRNWLSGGGGSDTLTGGRGPDDMDGGFGSDILYGGDGKDTLYGNRYYSYAVENDTLYGGNGRDLIDGDAGDDLLFGGGDVDRLRLWSGNDRAYGGEGDDKITVSLDHGIDRVHGGVGFDSMTIFGSSSLLAVGRLMNGIYKVSIDGNVVLRAESVEQLSIQGGNLGDSIDGLSGDDYIGGSVKFPYQSQPELDADRLRGMAGNDTLEGLFGQDTLTGGSGADLFLFSSVLHSGATLATADRITDFEQGVDRIDLREIDANTGTRFKNESFVLVDAFDGTAGQAVLSTLSAGRWLLELDQTGDGVADMALDIRGALAPLATDIDW